MKKEICFHSKNRTFKANIIFLEGKKPLVQMVDVPGPDAELNNDEIDDFIQFLQILKKEARS